MNNIKLVCPMDSGNLETECDYDIDTKSCSSICKPKPVEGGLLTPFEEKELAREPSKLLTKEGIKEWIGEHVFDKDVFWAILQTFGNEVASIKDAEWAERERRALDKVIEVKNFRQETLKRIKKEIDCHFWEVGYPSKEEYNWWQEFW